MAIDYNEADTCRLFVTPAIKAAGWEQLPHSITEQRTFTDGRIIVSGGASRRGPQKKADYILRYHSDMPLAVVEAKPVGEPASKGLQQAKDYAEILDLKFAYATNGREIVEFDYTTGIQRELTAYPSPEELWARYSNALNLTPQVAEHLLMPSNRETGRPLRYYQEIAVNRAVQSISQGRRRNLLTLATGTGKTLVAFQICWKLWNSRWNKSGEYRRPRILFLADRNILVDDPKIKEFAPFGDAQHKIGNGKLSMGREMYFAIYQAIAPRDGSEGVYKRFAPDFFDLIVVDECHRGSARDDSNWREVLEYFHPAYQLGMTATPLREDNRDTYQYFGNPLYTYSLKQGIEDGFLAPYTVHRIVTTVDATGWRPNAGELDRYGREIPDQEYTTPDFDRLLVMEQRTMAIARHLTDFMRRNGRYDKTIIFCVDQEHALQMQHALAKLNPDMLREYPDYVGRITADEGDIGRGLLDKFKDVTTASPVIVTTSKLLTTGVDVPTCKNVVLVRVVNTMTEFKQIIGRGTRVRDDYDKLFFNILDYTGSATRLFADPEFDGDPALIIESEMDENGETISLADVTGEHPVLPPEPLPPPDLGDKLLTRRKFYIDGVEVNIAASVEYVLDEGGKRRVVSYTHHTAEQVRTLFANSAEMRAQWEDPTQRAALIDRLDERGIDFERLMAVMGEEDADPFDLLCHVAFNAPIRTRRERANRVRQEEMAFFQAYTEPARRVLHDLLEKYAEHGTTQFTMDILKVPPISEYGSLREIAGIFGGAEALKAAVERLQTLLYAA